MKQLIVMLVGVICMGVWSTVLGFFEERMYCSFESSQVRVVLDEWERLCTTYIELIASASDRAASLADTAYQYSERAIVEEDVLYRLNISRGYERQQRQLQQFGTLIEDAMVSFERVVLLRVQWHLYDILELDILRCMNTRPDFRITYVESRYPLCRLGQERQINIMQTTDDLDDFVHALRAYVARRQKILANSG